MHYVGIHASKYTSVVNEHTHTRHIHHIYFLLYHRRMQQFLLFVLASFGFLFFTFCIRQHALLTCTLHLPKSKQTTTYHMIWPASSRIDKLFILNALHSKRDDGDCKSLLQSAVAVIACLAFEHGCKKMRCVHRQLPTSHLIFIQTNGCFTLY